MLGVADIPFTEWAGQMLAACLVITGLAFLAISFADFVGDMIRIRWPF